MPSTYTSRIRAEKQAAGENSNTWGTRLNTNTIDLIDDAIAGVESFTLSGTKTLTDNDGAADEARMAVLNITSGTGGTVTIPNVSKRYLVRNACSGRVTFTTGSGTTTYVPPGNVMEIFCDGSNAVYRAGGTKPRLTSTDTTITPDDDGGEVRSSSSAQRDFTVAPESSGAWADNASVVCFGGSSGAIRIVQGSGVTVNWNGSTGTRTIAAGHRAYLDRDSSNSWLLSGSGIT